MSKTAKKAAAPKAKATAPKPAKVTKAATPKAKKPLADDFEKFRRPLPQGSQQASPTEPEGGRYVIISGEGTMPLGADNWRRVPRGTSIPVSADELAWLERSGVAFKRA